MGEKHPFKLLRWLLVIPAGLLGYFIAYLFTVSLQLLIEDHFCPEHYQIQGDMLYCLLPDHILAMFIALGGALTAILVVLLCTLTAPGHRKKIAWITFSIGASIALIMIFQLETTMMLTLFIILATLGAGLITTVYIQRSKRPLFNCH